MSDDTEGMGLTRASIRRIDRVVNAVEHSPLLNQPQSFQPNAPQSIWYYAKVAFGSTMTTASLEVPTTFLFDVWVPDPDSSADPIPFVITTDSDFVGLTGVNRSVMTADAGMMIKIHYGPGGEWSPFWVDCDV